MLEIAALIRKAQATTDNAVELAERKKQKSKISTEPIQDENIGKSILANLDRFINDLEAQKNLATFGLGI